MIILFLKKYSRFLKKLGKKLSYDPTIPLLGKYPEKTRTERDIRTPMFVAALFTTTRIWKQTDEAALRRGSELGKCKCVHDEQ